MNDSTLIQCISNVIIHFNDMFIAIAKELGNLEVCLVCALRMRGVKTRRKYIVSMFVERSLPDNTIQVVRVKHFIMPPLTVLHSLFAQ